MTEYDPRRGRASPRPALGRNRSGGRPPRPRRRGPARDGPAPGAGRGGRCGRARAGPLSRALLSDRRRLGDCPRSLSAGPRHPDDRSPRIRERPHRLSGAAAGGAGRGGRNRRHCRGIVGLGAGQAGEGAGAGARPGSRLRGRVRGDAGGLDRPAQRSPGSPSAPGCGPEYPPLARTAGQCRPSLGRAGPLLRGSGPRPLGNGRGDSLARGPSTSAGLAPPGRRLLQQGGDRPSCAAAPPHRLPSRRIPNHRLSLRTDRAGRAPGHRAGRPQRFLAGPDTAGECADLTGSRGPRGVEPGAVPIPHGAGVGPSTPQGQRPSARAARRSSGSAGATCDPGERSRRADRRHQRDCPDGSPLRARRPLRRGDRQCGGEGRPGESRRERRRDRGIGEAPDALLPGAISRIPNPARPLWDDEAAAPAPERGDGWPGEVEIHTPGRRPIFCLPREGLAGLGLEGELLLGWRAGDAIRAELS